MFIDLVAALVESFLALRNGMIDARHQGDRAWPRSPGQVQKVEESGLGERFQAGVDPEVGGTIHSPGRVVLIWQFDVQHCQAPSTGQPIKCHSAVDVRSTGIVRLRPRRPSPLDLRLVPGAGGALHVCHLGPVPSQS